MTDALARVVPVAAPLLRDVDATLASLGAPDTHPVWRLLGAVGMTPVGLVEFVAELEPDRLRAAGQRLREWARTYAEGSIPDEASWQGEAARHYAVTLSGLRDHVEGLGARLTATASYVDGLAEWQQQLRDDLARALARVMSSGEAAALRMRQTRHSDPGALTGAVAAAADIGAVLLRVAQEAGAHAQDIIHASGLEELAYQSPAHETPTSYNGPIGITQ
jgi:hypothetical protein